MNRLRKNDGTLSRKENKMQVSSLGKEGAVNEGKVKSVRREFASGNNAMMKRRGLPSPK